MRWIYNLLQKSLISSFLILASTPAKAQITPDNTLGKESSQFNQNVLINGLNTDKIDGGATRGSNLFHSFSQFNINDGQRVYFANPVGVLNILSRVTGGNASNILGTLGVDGAANLFLMNPNGILFGQNASLDVRGSFVGTTANALAFGNQGVFSATNPEAPPLLTINPSALLFNQINQNAAIQNNSRASAGKDPASVDVFGLRVPDGKSLLLVGGNVSMDGGWLVANGGRIELGGLAETGSIGIESDGNNFRLSFPDGVQRGDISLTNKAIVGVIGGGGGSIVANARNLEILAGSEFFAGIGEGLGTANTQAGDITVDATGQIKLAGTDSLIFNSVQSRAIGNGGNIDIKTGSLSVTEGAQIDSFTRGRGNAGNITIQAKDTITFDGVGSNAFPSASFSDVQPGAIGNGGSINITAGSLSLTNGGLLGVSVREATDTLPSGQGIGGTVNVNVRDALTISGADSGIFGSLGTGAVGRGGDIKVQAGNVFVKDDGNIISSTFGQGDSGNIFITASDAISLDVGGIYNNVQSGEAKGNAGNIDITTSSLALTNGAQINSFTRGQGNAGNIIIQATDAVTFDGIDSNGNESGLFSVVGNDATGNGGAVNITSGSLSLNNGGRLGIYVSDASDVLEGKKAIGGTANINVRDAFRISGVGSGIFASLGSNVVGTGGNVNIKAGNLSIQDAGEISSNNFGRGNAGNINITTGSLNIANRAGIFADTYAQGNGGNITVEAGDLVEILSDSDLDSDVLEDAIGNAGDIIIKTRRLIVRDSQIGTSTFSEGNAGNFKIIATDSVELSGQIPKRDGDTSNSGSVGFPGGLFAQIDLNGKGRGGNLTIETRRLSVSDGSKIQAATFGDGDAGNIFIRADEIDLFETEKPNFFNTGIFAGVQTDGRVEAGLIDPRNGRPPIGNGGNLTIETRKLSLRNGSEVFVQTSGEGNAGKLVIRASESVNVTGVSIGNLERLRTSSITAGASKTSTGNGGSLTIETPLLNVADNGIITSSSDGKGTAGDINISGDITRLNNGKIVAQTASTDGGNINLNLSQYLLLRNNSQISTTAGTAQAGGNGGNITIDAPFIVAVPNEDSDITANAFIGTGGNINIETQGIFGIVPAAFPIPEKSEITASSELGLQGEIDITQPDIDPTQGLIELPQQVVDASNQISQLCPRGELAFRRPLNQFIITGRGIPPNPLQPLPGKPGIRQLASLDNEEMGRQGRQEKQGDRGGLGNSQVVTTTIIEAQGFIKAADGTITLVAQAPNATPSSYPNASVCPLSK